MIATEPRPQRAPALPPDERRAAIVAATLPLVLQHGPGVSTRLIALACGIAEGTIFRVFPDKDTLIDAVVDAAFDPAPTESALGEIDLALPFTERLGLAVDIVQRRTEHIWRLTEAIGHKGRSHSARRTPIDLVGLARVFEPDRDRLLYEPVAAARILRALTMSASHPALVGDNPMQPGEIVALLLDGIRRR